MGIYILLGGITLIAVTITVLDWLSRQQRRRAHKH